MRRLLLLLFVLVFGWPLPAFAQSGDDIAVAGRGVTRVLAIVQLPDGQSGASFGSGFAVSSRHVVTNYHVIRIYDQFEDQASDAILGVVPSEGARPLRARIVATNPSKDLAVLELIDGTLNPLRVYMGDPPSGEQVTALGYPANVDNATIRTAREFVTPMQYIRSNGIYSSSRVVAGNQIYIHDANIGRGNSGGPLVDRCGRVMGVNSSMPLQGDGDAQFSFAISNNELNTFLTEARITPIREGGACQTRAERAAQRQQQVDAAATAARGACDARNRQTQDSAARELEADTRSESERRLFIALALLVFGGLALGGAGLFAAKEQKNNAAACAGVGLLLLVGAAVVFVMRGSDDFGDDAPTAENCEAAAMQAGNAAAANLIGDSAANVAEAFDGASNAH